MPPIPFDAEAAAVAAGQAPTGELPTPPRLRLAVVTCMDARVLPHELLGLEAGDAHVMRNAGGRVTPDVVRSLLLSTRLLGVTQVVVMHHTRCGGASDDAELAAALREAGVEGPLPALHGAGDQVAALRADVDALSADPLLDDALVVAGYRYDLDSGAVVPLEELEGARTS